MRRFNELLHIIEFQYPDDWWLKDFLKIQEAEDEDFLNQAKIYENALSLSEDSWEVLKRKASVKFKADCKKRGKYQIFNLLNESLAYEFLVGMECKRVEFVEEGKAPTPDLKFVTDAGEFYCEVKTIEISDEEIARYKNRGSYSSVDYSTLSNGFFIKLCSDIEKAAKQIGCVSPENVIYLIVNFDDFTGFFYQKYRVEITQYIENQFPNLQIYIRTGLNKRFEIHVKPFNA